MNTYLNEAVAIDRRDQRIADAAAARRSRTDRKAKGARTRTRSLRIAAFVKHAGATGL